MFGVCSRKRKEDEENETEQFGISMEQSLISDLAMHKSYIWSDNSMKISLGRL